MTRCLDCVSWRLRVAEMFCGLRVWLALHRGEALRAVGVKGPGHAVVNLLAAGPTWGMLWPLRVRVVGAWFLAVATAFVVCAVVGVSRASGRSMVGLDPDAGRQRRRPERAHEAAHGTVAPGEAGRLS
jgi:hypothetical protein